MFERGNDFGQRTAVSNGLDCGWCGNLARDFRLPEAETLSDVHDSRREGERRHERARYNRTGEKRKPKHRVYRVERIRSTRSKGNANRRREKFPGDPWV